MLFPGQEGISPSVVVVSMQIKKKDSEKKKEKKCKLQSFIKVCNLNQLMPTRYSLDLDLKNAIGIECLANKTQKKESIQVM